MAGRAHGAESRLEFAGHHVIGGRERRIHRHKRRLIAALADNGVRLVQAPVSTPVGFLHKLMVLRVMDAKNPLRRIMADDRSHLDSGHMDFHFIGVEPFGPGNALDMPSRIVLEGAFVPVIRQPVHNIALPGWGGTGLRPEC